MQIAILLFDRFTVLDAIGPYQVLSSLPGAEVAFVAERPGPISDEQGSLILSAEAGLPDVPHPDVIVVPGGPGQNGQMQDGPGARVAQSRRPDERLDHLGVHRIAHPGRRRAADRPPRNHALAGPGRARSASARHPSASAWCPTEST